MGKYKVVKLKFTSPLHIGKGVGDAYDTSSEVLHSDTISGALASTFVALYGADQLKSFLASYRVSSAFPFLGDHYFLPKPYAFVPLHDQNNGREVVMEGKEEKRIEFIDVLLWNQFIKQGVVRVQRQCISQCGKFVFDNREANGLRLYQNMLTQRAYVPRFGSEDTVPFFFERTFFRPDSGLYFLFDVEEKWTSSFKVAVEYLGMNGFGTDKNVGHGQFEVDYSELTIDTPANGNGMMLLSLYCPHKTEIDESLLNKSAYQLIRRGGFIAGAQNDAFWHLRKRSIYMFSEGSIFFTNSLDGKVENVRPTWNDQQLHEIYRDGRAFGIPIELKEMEEI